MGWEGKAVRRTALSWCRLPLVTVQDAGRIAKLIEFATVVSQEPRSVEKQSKRVCTRQGIRGLPVFCRKPAQCRASVGFIRWRKLSFFCPPPHPSPPVPIPRRLPTPPPPTPPSSSLPAFLFVKSELLMRLYVTWAFGLCLQVPDTNIDHHTENGQYEGWMKSLGCPEHGLGRLMSCSLFFPFFFFFFFDQWQTNFTSLYQQKGSVRDIPEVVALTPSRWISHLYEKDVTRTYTVCGRCVSTRNNDVRKALCLVIVSKLLCKTVFVTVEVRERQTDRQTDRQTETERQRKRKKETETESERQRELI